jgi:hypothetical protein
MHWSWIIYSLKMNLLWTKLCRFRAATIINFTVVGQFAFPVRSIVLSYCRSSSRTALGPVSYVDVTAVSVVECSSSMPHAWLYHTELWKIVLSPWNVKSVWIGLLGSVSAIASLPPSPPFPPLPSHPYAILTLQWILFCIFYVSWI